MESDPTRNDMEIPVLIRPPATTSSRFLKRPPLWVWVVVSLCLAMIVWFRSGDVMDDHAIGNIFTGVFLLVAMLTIAIWYVCFSGVTATTRLVMILGGLGVVVLFFSVFVLDNVSGELIPRFRWRFAKSRDANLAKPQVVPSQAPVDLAQTTLDDFGQFLGPNRSGWIEGPRLSRDWSSPPRELWRHPIGAGWSAFSAVNGFAVTLEQRAEEELVTCYEIYSGNLVWSHAEQQRHESVLGGIGPRSTPTIHEGYVYTLGATGVLLCLNGSNGAVVWRDDLLKRYSISTDYEVADIAWGRSNSPLIVADKLIVPVGGNRNKRVSIAAFDRLTGDLIWETGNEQVSYSSPSIGEFFGRRQLLVVNESSVTGHDPLVGTLLWSHPWEGKTNAAASASQAIPIPPNRVFLSKAYGIGSSLIELTPGSDAGVQVKTIWHERNAMKTKFTNAVVHENSVYGLSDGILECLELETGKRRWKHGRYGQGQILGVGSLILVQAESGDVVLVEANPESHVELGRFAALDGKTWNNLCLYGRYLLVRNGEEAACFELP